MTPSSDDLCGDNPGRPTLPMEQHNSWGDRLKAYRQGDFLEMKTVPVVTDGEETRWDPSPYGVVVITQTCDLVLEDRPTAHIAPVVHLDENASKAARKGRRPNLVHVPDLGPRVFADLTTIGTVDKAYIATFERRAGVSNAEDIRKFGQRIGRRFSRFAFPDDVVPWISPLQALVQDKSGRVSSPSGWALERVASLRLGCAENWATPPYELTLYVVMEPDGFPVFDKDSLPEVPEGLHKWLYGTSGKFILQRKPAEIAGRLMQEAANLNSVERYWLWSALADGWAQLCVPANTETRRSVLSAVAGGAISAEIMSTEDFSFEMYRHSDEIDLDHLSSPLPL